MKAIIICDDFSLFAKANAALQRVGWRSEVNARWTIKSWPQNILSQAGMAEKTLIEATDADLVIIPAQHARSLSFDLHEWLEQWAAVRQIQDAALAVIGDGTHADYPKTVSSELTLLVLKHGLNLIIDEDSVARNATKVNVRFPLERELPLLLELHRIEYAATHDSLRGFGINE